MSWVLSRWHGRGILEVRRLGNVGFYEELNAVIQHEPADAFNTELVGVLASIGIKKGQPFARTHG